ncbi:E3 ubiquitin-protein ligase TRIM71-like [Tachypleus tridentatus]|uniref:E3 ubiquitin-protein ligase TRIM71-like n=1 Tax=Tachypleus tridentatus TaxID=6853 RepID=UPI003FD4BC29
MSEVIMKKANICINRLNTATENVNNELCKLEENLEKSCEIANHTFYELLKIVENRKQDLLSTMKKYQVEKKGSLLEQLATIKREKLAVDQLCQGLDNEVEVRNIFKKICLINEKMNNMPVFGEPRENGFITYEYEHNRAFDDLQTALGTFGKVRTSTTFSPLCTAQVEDISVHLEGQTLVTAVDFKGNPQSVGGDPLVVEIFHENGELVKATVVDNSNGTYTVKYRTEMPGVYKLHITIFGRPIKDSPFRFEALQDINPVVSFGTTGCEDNQFLQPCAVAISPAGQIFVLDTGNNRIKVLGPDLEFIHHIVGVGLEECGGTGIAVTHVNSLLVINWKTKYITELTFDGEFISQSTHSDFVEPMDIAVNSQGEILILDNNLNCVFILDESRNLLQKIELTGFNNTESHAIKFVAVGPKDEILVGDSSVLVFGSSGEFLKEIYPEGRNGGHFGGLVSDKEGNLLVCRSEKNKHYIQIFNFVSGHLLFCINSPKTKLKRPAGVAILKMS